MNVTLTASDLYVAATGGMLRTIENIIKSANSAHGADADGLNWTISIQGAIAEYAISKALDVHWHGKGVMRGDDVGKYQARSTHHQNGRLIIYEDDADNKPFILVIGEKKEYRLSGWMMGGEAKQQKYWDESMRDPCYCVPQRDLRKMDTLV